MSSDPVVGVLRTAGQQSLDEPGHFGDQPPSSWDVIPGVKVRNDGVYPAVLLPGSVYSLEHDGIGWQLTPEGHSPHGYLVDGALEPVERLELADRPLMLMPGRRYSVSPDGTGAWRLREHANGVTR
ncbi:MAG TPA: hypothetical protein VMV92_38255 [Streptosporangiaceae bacterium]|nr:hypothetical protein [Streptosporangiaceae bacterium]